MRSRYDVLFILGWVTACMARDMKIWSSAGSFDLYRHAITAFVVRGCNASEMAQEC